MRVSRDLLFHPGGVKTLAFQATVSAGASSWSSLSSWSPADFSLPPEATAFEAVEDSLRPCIGGGIVLSRKSKV